MIWLKVVSECSFRTQYNSLLFKVIPAQKITKRHVLVRRNMAAVKYKYSFSEIWLLQSVKKLQPRDPRLLGSGLVQWWGPELQLQLRAWKSHTGAGQTKHALAR